MGIISPSSWVGWTAVLIVVVLAVVAGMADGVHRSIKCAAWTLAAVVAVVAAYNSWMQR